MLSPVVFQVIRHYHGHLSAVHDISLHPTIDVLVTCGRDSTARVMSLTFIIPVFIVMPRCNFVC
jgi:WD40 repeat protein